MIWFSAMSPFGKVRVESSFELSWIIYHREIAPLCGNPQTKNRIWPSLPNSLGPRYYYKTDRTLPDHSSWAGLEPTRQNLEENNTLHVVEIFGRANSNPMIQHFESKTENSNASNQLKLPPSNPSLLPFPRQLMSLSLNGTLPTRASGILPQGSGCHLLVLNPYTRRPTLQLYFNTNDHLIDVELVQTLENLKKGNLALLTTFVSVLISCVGLCWLAIGNLSLLLFGILV